MMELRITKHKFNHENKNEIKVFLNSLKKRKKEVTETLNHEKIKLEAFFIENTTLYILFYCENWGTVEKTYKTSINQNLFKIDIEFQKFKKKYLTSSKKIESFTFFENFK